MDSEKKGGGKRRRKGPQLQGSPAKAKASPSESGSVMSNSLRPHGHESWNSSGQKVAIPPPGDLPNPGMEPRSPALQIDSLPSDPPGGGGWGGTTHRLFSVSSQFPNCDYLTTQRL